MMRRLTYVALLCVGDYNACQVRRNRDQGALPEAHRPGEGLYKSYSLGRLRYRDPVSEAPRWKTGAHRRRGRCRAYVLRTTTIRSRRTDQRRKRPKWSPPLTTSCRRPQACAVSSSARPGGMTPKLMGTWTVTCQVFDLAGGAQTTRSNCTAFQMRCPVGAASAVCQYSRKSDSKKKPCFLLAGWSLM